MATRRRRTVDETSQPGPFTAAGSHGSRGSGLRTTLEIVSVVVFPVTLLIFAAVYVHDRWFYLSLLRENGPVESPTVVVLVLVSVTSVLVARLHRRRQGRYPWFYVMLAILGALGALEEISWGQQILKFKSPEFFLRHARQEETGIHNVVQKWTTLKVKDVAPVVFAVYGIVLPIAKARNPGIRAWLERKGVGVPRLILTEGFFLGSLLMLDRPTRREEELGELFLSSSVLLFVLFEYLNAVDRLRRDGMMRSGAEPSREPADDATPGPNA